MKLPNRPPNHELATKAERKFESLLPPAWTVEWVRNDYGLDGLVTPFEDGHPTGDIIGIQLKGTSSGEANVSIPLATTTLNYFAIAKHPIWLIVYDQAKDQCMYLDMHDELRRIAKERGPTWRDQETIAVRLDRMTNVSETTFSSWQATPSPLLPELDRIQEERAKEILETAVDLLSTGNSSELATRVNTRLATGGTQTTKQELEGLLLASGVARQDGEKLALAAPSAPALLSMLELGAARALDWFGALGWHESAEPEALGKLVAFTVANGRAPASLVDGLWAPNPEAYLWSVQYLMFLAPSQCTFLAGVQVKTQTLALSPSQDPTAVQHELRFSDNDKRARWHARVVSETGPFFELVAVDNIGYIVEMHPEAPAKPGDVRLISIEGIGRGKGKNVGIRSSQKPERVRPHLVWTTLGADEPLASAFMIGPMLGFAALVIDGKPFVVSGPQRSVISSDGTTDRMSVDGIAIIDQRSNMQADNLPAEFGGRTKATIRTTKANDELRGVAFYKPNEKLPVPSSVLEILRERYKTVLT